MRSVWRLGVASSRRWPLGLCVVAVLAFALPSGALAQSGVGRAANAATGESLRDSIEQNQNELINSSGVGSGSSGAGAAIGAGASPTGRLRSSTHDALNVQNPPDEGNYGWKTKEGSAFATGVYSLPGTVLGGQMKVSLFGGQNWLSLEMKNGGGNFLDVDNGQFGKARNESVLFGGTALWSQKNTYVVATLVGMWGETSLTDAVDFCNTPPGGCPVRHYKFDTSGFNGSLTAGNVFPLSRSPSGPMLDLRGAVGYTQSTGDNFFNFEGDEQKYKFSTWTLTGSATLFANVTLQNSALLRPYIQGYVRQEVGYNNKLFAHVVGDPPDLVHWDQAHTYGGVDIGATYTLGNMTLGAAAYVDGSADELTLGGRLGASWKLN
jgi:hypothetical protein